eukprot:14681957-Alexandrium_andersonii.AAC.1
MRALARDLHSSANVRTAACALAVLPIRGLWRTPSGRPWDRKACCSWGRAVWREGAQRCAGLVLCFRSS